MISEEEIYLRQVENHLAGCRDAMDITAEFARRYAKTVDSLTDKRAWLEINRTMTEVLSLLDGRPVPIIGEVHDDKPNNTFPNWKDDPKNDQVLGYNPADGGM